MARGNQIVRQWQLLRLLQNSRRGVRAAELAEQLEANERTVFRDLNDLAAAGFGVHSEDGCWKVDERERPPIPLTEADALGLSLCLDALAPLGGLEATRALEELRGKIEAALPETARKRAAELRDTQLATFTAPTESLDPLAEALERGCRLEQSVRIRYRAYDGEETERVIDPYTLWFADGSLYVIAYCQLRQAVRHFLVARVLDAEVTDETFDRDPTFEARAHIAHGFGVWVGEKDRIELVFGPEWAHLAAERKLHASQELTRLPDGSARVRFEASGLPALARWVASMGGAVRVAAPSRLRDMVREIHLAGVEAQGGKPPARALASDSLNAARVAGGRDT